MLEHIFKIEKEKKHILFEFWGIKLRIKLPLDKKKIKQFESHKVLPNTILLAEFNDCHKETIVGYYYYLRELGYNVEVLLRHNDEGVFCRVEEPIVEWLFNEKEIKYIFEKCNLKKYERVIFNSKILYMKNAEDINTVFKKLQSGKKESIFVQHHLERFYDKITDKQIILANPARVERFENLIVNPHYFGKVEYTPKNVVTNFITIGELNPKRRNFDLLVNAVKSLHNAQIENFKITVIGRGEVEVFDEEIRKYFDIKGRLDFPSMYSELENSDFILTLLDPQNEQHDRYKQFGTSGSFQLVYGFLKPCLIHKDFAEIYDFNSKDSIVYEKNEDLASAMELAIKMNQEKYAEKIENLKKNVQKVEELSMRNLKEILNG